LLEGAEISFVVKITKLSIERVEEIKRDLEENKV
jgi:hypothetical protein